MLITTIGEVGGADTLKIEGLVLESVPMGHMGTGCQAEFPIISIRAMWVKGGEVVCIVRPRSHKASKAKGFRGNMWKNIQGVSWDNIRELRDYSRGRWRHILSIGGRISVRRSRGKSRGMVRT